MYDVYMCEKLIQDNFNTVKMIKIGPQTVVVLPLKHGPLIFVFCHGNTFLF